MRRFAHEFRLDARRRPARSISGASVLCLAALLWLASARDAHAYLDPGTGSILLQALIGGGMAALFFLRKHWQALRSRVSGRPASPSTDESGKDASEVR